MWPRFFRVKFSFKGRSSNSVPVKSCSDTDAVPVPGVEKNII